MPETLVYQNTPMRTDVSVPPGDVYSLAVVRAKLLRHSHVEAVLEPGDCSRYDLLLTPIGTRQRGVVVTRMRSGHVVATIVLWDWDEGASPFQIMEAGRTLGEGNDWSVDLFTWWLTLLCTEG